MSGAMDFAFLFIHGSIPTGPSSIQKAADIVFARTMFGRVRRIGGLFSHTGAQSQQG